MTATLAPPLLEARGLGFQRQDEAIFGPLDFCLHAGELILIEGDNGSGKTTLLRILSGLLRHEQGELRWRGELMHGPGHDGELLLLGHHLGLKQELSARENLQAAIGLHGHRADLDSDTALNEVGLGGYADERVRSLSAGQKKRVALARLLLLPGKVWLLDEPYANLDRSGIELVNRILRQHAQRGGAALLTGHLAVSFLGAEAKRVQIHG